MRRTWVLIAAGVILAAAVIGTAVWRRRAAPPAPAQRAAGAVTLPEGSQPNQYTFTGIIRPQHVANVGTDSAGNIEEFLVQPGDEVYEGQPLARLGSFGMQSQRENAASAVERAQDRVTKAEATVSNALMEQSRADADSQRLQAALNRAQAEYNKQKSYYAQGATPRNTYLKAEREYQDALDQYSTATRVLNSAAEYATSSQKLLNSAKEELAARNKDLQDIEADMNSAVVESPVDGLVVARNGDPGTPAQEVGDQMFQIATDIFALEVPVEPPPPVLSRVHPGMQTMVLIPEAINYGLEGQVKTIEGTKVVVQFTSPMATIRPGMKADVRFRLD